MKTRIDLTPKIHLDEGSKNVYYVIYDDPCDHMITTTGYQDDNFNVISWIKPNNYEAIIVNETEINGKKITRITQDTEGNYTIYT